MRFKEDDAPRWLRGSCSAGDYSAPLFENMSLGEEEIDINELVGLCEVGYLSVSALRVGELKKTISSFRVYLFFCISWSLKICQNSFICMGPSPF